MAEAKAEFKGVVAKGAMTEIAAKALTFAVLQTDNGFRKANRNNMMTRIRATIRAATGLWLWC